MKKTKKYFAFYFIVIIAGLMGAFASLFFTLSVQKNFQYNVNPIVCVALLLLTVMLCCIWNQGAYMAALRLFGFHIELAVLFGFFYVGSSGKKRVGFARKSIFSRGVIPRIKNVESEQQLERIQNNLAYSALAAPLFSLLLAGICFYMQGWVVPLMNVNLKGIIFMLCWFSIIVNLYINVVAFFQDCSVLEGGYKAFKNFYTHDAAAMQQIYRYIECTNTDISGTKVLDDMLIRELTEKCSQNNIKVEDYWYLNKILYRYLVYKDEIAIDIIKILNQVIENMRQREFLTETEVVLFAHIVMYMAENNREKAVKCWNEWKNRIPQAKLYNYYKAQVECLLFQKKEPLEISRLQKSSQDNFFMHLEGYFNSEIMMNIL